MLDLNTQDLLPWIEKYRPKSLYDIISHRTIIDTLDNFISSSDMPHLLFHGPPGTGKTSVALAAARKIYGNDMSVMTMEINASEERGIEVVRNRIIQFACTHNMLFTEDNKKKFKLIILDEADAMTPDAQASLRRVIEKYTRNVRFCLICNYIKKIDIALQSRCTCFRFAPLKRNYIFHHISQILHNENIAFTESGINAVIDKSKGDMRKILNIMQSVSMSYNAINEDNVNKCLGYPPKYIIKDFVESLFFDTFIQSYNLIHDYKYKNGLSLCDIINEVYDYLISILTSNNLSHYNVTELYICNIIKNLANIEYNVASTIDETIQFSAFISAFKINYE